MRPFINRLFETRSGIQAYCWSIHDGVKTKSIWQNGQVNQFKLEGTLGLWLDVAIMNSGKEFIESIDFDIIIGKAELFAGTEFAVLNYIVSNNLTYNSESGPVSFGSGIVEVS